MGQNGQTITNQLPRINKSDIFLQNSGASKPEMKMNKVYSELKKNV